MQNSIIRTYAVPTGREKKGYGSELRREYDVGYLDTATLERWEETEWRAVATLDTSQEDRDRYGC